LAEAIEAWTQSREHTAIPWAGIASVPDPDWIDRNDFYEAGDWVFTTSIDQQATIAKGFLGWLPFLCDRIYAVESRLATGPTCRWVPSDSRGGVLRNRGEVKLAPRQYPHPVFCFPNHPDELHDD
jgi:hypothetical protein